MSATILLVDDDETTLSFLSPLLHDAGYEVVTATTLKSAQQAIERGDADIVVLDVQLPDGYGPNLLERINREQPHLPVIIVTGYGEIDMAVEAMKLGARDFIQKPLDVARLVQAVHKAAESVALYRELTLLRNVRKSDSTWIFGTTPAMQRLENAIGRVAPVNTTVLIVGESGTGKEGLAAMIHKLSPRASKAWVPVNCANFSDTLLESELFGYEAGSFTGATKKKDGLFMVADGGTLFLDEISTMKHELQARLLRVLEERAIRRLGGHAETKVDVRILAATNRDLAEMVRAGDFREDLYHRLNVVELRLPPLRERKEDIPVLVGYFIQKYNQEMGHNVQGVGPRVLEALKAYTWPGNIRQLRNAIERAMLFTDGDTLDLGHFAPDISGLAD
jgi:two-component system, NtrC family, response regulator AtoC